MNIKSFEKQFNKTILNRGINYYEDGHVEDVIRINEQNWQADVLGSYTYVVDMRITANGQITYMDCDCPYDDYCKHIVAVLYEIREQWQTAPKFTMPIKKETLDQQLQGQTKEQLIALLLKMAQNQPAVTKELEMLFTKPQDTIKAAEQLITHYMNAAQNQRDGFIPWNQVAKALKGIETVQESIHEQIENGTYFTAVQLGLLCLEQALEAMLNSQDSGEFGDSIEESLAYIEQAVREGVDLWDAKQSETVYELIIKIAMQETLRDWPEWYTSLLQSCIPLCKEDPIEKNYMSLLHSLFDKRDKWCASYPNKLLKELQLQLITTKYGKEKAATFLEQNIENADMRERVIVSAMERKDYEKVVQLCIEGQEQDQENPSIVIKWLRYAYAAHKELKQLQQMREVVVQLLLRNDYDYYGEYKLLHPEQHWPDALEQLLDQLKEARSTLYEKIIVKEQLPTRILAYCNEEPTRIEHYYAHIHEHYYEEVCALFIDTIHEAAKQATTRKQYQKVCHSITIMQKAGYKFEATQLIEDLLQSYPKRRAFVDELQQLNQ